MDLFSDFERKITIRISELGSITFAKQIIEKQKIETELEFFAHYPFHYAALSPNTIAMRKVFGGMLGAFIPRGEATLEFTRDQLNAYCSHFKNAREASDFLEGATAFGFNNQKRRDGLLAQIAKHNFTFVLRDFISLNKDFQVRNDKSTNLTDLCFEAFLGEATEETTILDWMVSVSNNETVFDIMFPHLSERYSTNMRWHVLRPAFEKARRERLLNSYIFEMAAYLNANTHQEGSYMMYGAQRLTTAEWRRVIEETNLPKVDAKSGLKKYNLELDVIYIRGTESKSGDPEGKTLYKFGKSTLSDVLERRNRTVTYTGRKVTSEEIFLVPNRVHYEHQVLKFLKKKAKQNITYQWEQWGNIPARMIEKAHHSSRTEYFYAGEQEMKAIRRYLSSVQNIYSDYLTDYEADIHRTRMDAIATVRERNYYSEYIFPISDETFEEASRLYFIMEADLQRISITNPRNVDQLELI